MSKKLFRTKAKRLGTAMALAVAVAASAAGGLTACRRAEEETPRAAVADTDFGKIQGSEKRADNISAAVHLALLEENRGRYADAEFWAEGHEVLGERESDGEIKVYAVTSVGGYSFMNGKFVKDSGSGAVPAVITLLETEEGYSSAEIEYPKDGAYYSESIREMFPDEALRLAALTADEYYGELMRQEREQAEEYLKGMGREAEVCEYADLGAELPELSEETWEAVQADEKSDGREYPHYIGSVERLEGGKRYIYETAWDGKTLTHIKYDEDGNALEQRSYRN